MYLDRRWCKCLFVSIGLHNAFPLDLKWQLSSHLSPEGITENWGNNFQYSTDWLHSLWRGTLLVLNSVASLLIVWVCLFRYVPSCHQITYLTFSDNGLNLHCLVIDLLKTFQNPIWGAVCSCCIISIEMHVKTHHLLKVVKPLSDTKARHVSLSKLSRIGTQQIIFHFFAHCTMNTNSLLMPVSRVTRYKHWKFNLWLTKMHAFDIHHSTVMNDSQCT